MGGGIVISDHADQRRVDVPREWLKPLIKGSYADVFAARGEGDSMEPTLRDGDIVIVDTAQNAVNSQDRVWCIGHGDLGMIKRLRARPDGGIEIMSDNSAVSSFIAYDGEVQIIGRVVFIGRRM
jgi:phage repressor protein C with HTH and peptisase S24 domain